MDRQSDGKIFLIGFMGTGKSSVGRLLADRLGWARVDVDEEIVKAERRAIADIFASEGEEAFRDIEARVLADIAASGKPMIVATGGGAVLRESNRTVMLAHGCVAALKASPETIIARVERDEARPLLQGNAAKRVYELLEQRKHAYDFAHVTVDTTDLTPEEVAGRIIRHWERREGAAST